MEIIILVIALIGAITSILHFLSFKKATNEIKNLVAQINQENLAITNEKILVNSQIQIKKSEIKFFDRGLEFPRSIRAVENYIRMERKDLIL